MRPMSPPRRNAAVFQVGLGARQCYNHVIDTSADASDSGAAAAGPEIEQFHCGMQLLLMAHATALRQQQQQQQPPQQQASHDWRGDSNVLLTLVTPALLTVLKQTESSRRAGGASHGAGGGPCWAGGPVCSAAAAHLPER